MEIELRELEEEGRSEILIDGVIVTSSWKLIDLIDEYLELSSDEDFAFRRLESAKFLNGIRARHPRDRHTQVSISFCEMGEHTVRPGSVGCEGHLDISVCDECRKAYLEKFWGVSSK